MPAPNERLLAAFLGAAVVIGLGGIALAAPEDDDPAAPAAKVRTESAAASAKPIIKAGSLAAYVQAADAVCSSAFAQSPAVDLQAAQALAYTLVVRNQSAALEVRTAQALLALPRPAVPQTRRVVSVLGPHRDAYAKVAAAAKPDGRSVAARAAAVAKVEGTTLATSKAAGAVFEALGSRRCSAWLNPAGEKDTGAA